VQKFDVPVEATTPSLEALKAYSMGITTQRSRGDAEAIPFLKRALELDPKFAIAYTALGVAYSNLGQASAAAENARKDTTFATASVKGKNTASVLPFSNSPVTYW